MKILWYLDPIIHCRVIYLLTFLALNIQNMLNTMPSMTQRCSSIFLSLALALAAITCCFKRSPLRYCNQQRWYFSALFSSCIMIGLHAFCALLFVEDSSLIGGKSTMRIVQREAPIWSLSYGVSCMIIKLALSEHFLFHIWCCCKNCQFNWWNWMPIWLSHSVRW